MKARIFLMALLMSFSISGFATPVYTGNTEGDSLDLDQGAGFYIWNDSVDTSDWYLYWTGDGASYKPVTFAGTLVFHNSLLDTYTEVSFSSGASDSSSVEFDTFPTGADEITFSAQTNNTGGWDGIEFTLSDGFELIEFNLTSNLFDGLTSTSAGDLAANVGSEAVGIWIGSDYDTPDVFVYDGGADPAQSFEIAVPEPGAIALLLLGLVSLVTARRKQA